MDFKELLKKFVEEDKINPLLEEMKCNKFFLASEENLDTRYSKLKEDNEGLKGQYDEANKLIEQLKTSNKGTAQLEAENNRLKIDSAIRVELLANKAKADDLDYLMFKIKQNNNELSIDENGKLKGFDEVLTGLKTSCVNQFEVEGKRKVDLNNLPNPDGNNATVTKEDFNKMSYSQKNELYKNDPETYKQLSK